MTQSNYIDLATVIEILDSALNEADALNATEYADDGKNNSTNRQTRDRLLYLVDSLSLASSLTKSEYWNGRLK